MRRRFVYRGGAVVAEFEGDTLVRAAPEYYEPTKVDGTFFVPDIQPYQSMVDGSMIGSRSQHREHLRQHSLIEIGNEQKHLMKDRQVQIDRKSAERRKQTIAAVLDKYRR
jgi:hypothetical protein